ncbi:uncharacterized protein N7500_009059 [Penicillium coprophilum]|uniref:uncharacterized protein n=1 Tax=Penicillium coprophilum TaxID=36646 RepID=UPI00238C15F0|nr:uncharacterized protein N7500_009059 [Penicillium coprophilum]KAJ5153620.1 hypothetical protein N7500_009059 [Penicillium coprophilum]
MASKEASTANEDFGDFVKNEDEEVDLEELVEPWYRYDTEDNEYPLYPIHLGEVLNERYLVEHKLGFGGGSTVWMAFDQQDKREVALKVMALGKWSDNEIRIQNEIIKTVQDTSRLVIYAATFFLPRDEKVNHRVLVVPVKGPSICTITLKRLPWPLVCLQLDNYWRLWQGYIKLESFIATIPFVDLWKKGELVSSVQVPEDLLRRDEFYLCDSGLAKKVGDLITQRGYPPMEYCTPDRLHKQEPSFACDMWSYMAILFHALPHISSVSYISRGWSRPLPQEWKGLYTHPGGLDSWYDQSQSPNPEHDLTAKIAYFRPDADPVERQHVLSIMSKVFVYDPEKRPTAVGLLRDPSFRAIMDRYGC